MGSFLRTALVACLVAGPFARPAAAVSLDDLFNLKANGLSDEVLVALIETDGSVFRLSAADVISLYKRGLSERVILAMIATGRRSNVPEPAIQEIAPAAPDQPFAAVPAAAMVPATFVQQMQAPVVSPTIVVEVPVAVPVAYPVAVAVPVGHVRVPEPIYWGFGGQRRPDTWQPINGPGRNFDPVLNRDPRANTPRPR